jgi:uncharacterized protein YjeT (DUF2065 family)
MQEFNMARSNLPVTKIIGIVLVVVGAGLAFWGYQQSGSVSSQVTEAFTGAAPDNVMTLYIGGAASVVVGLFLLLRR